MKKYMLEAEKYKKMAAWGYDEEDFDWVDQYSYIEVSLGCGFNEDVTEWGNGEEMINEYRMSTMWDDPSDLLDYAYEIIEDGKTYTNCDLASIIKEEEGVPFAWALDAIDEIRYPWMETLPLDEYELDTWIRGIAESYAYRGE